MARKSRKPEPPLPSDDVRHVRDLISRLEKQLEVQEEMRKRWERITLTGQTVEQLLGALRENNALLKAYMSILRSGRSVGS